MSKLKLYASNYINEDRAEFNIGRNLLRRKDTIGKVSRSGFKGTNRAKRFGKRIGRAGINKIKNSSRVRAGIKRIKSSNRLKGGLNKINNAFDR